MLKIATALSFSMQDFLPSSYFSRVHHPANKLNDSFQWIQDLRIIPDNLIEFEFNSSSSSIINNSHYNNIAVTRTALQSLSTALQSLSTVNRTIWSLINCFGVFITTHIGRKVCITIFPSTLSSKLTTNSAINKSELSFFERFKKDNMDLMSQCHHQ